MRSLVLVSSLLLAITSCRTTRVAEFCPQRLRAIFDVGSGTTKLNLSEVRVCADGVKLVRVLDDHTTRSISLEGAKTADGDIAPSGLAELRAVVGQMREHVFETARKDAPNYISIDFAAAGTHAFRTARNREAIVSTLASLGIPIVGLSQGEEANLAYDGACVRAGGCDGLEKITWDIGGGSMQFTRADGTFRGLPIGAEGFKSAVIAEFKLSGRPKCDAKIESANPVGVKNVEAAFALAVSKGHTNIEGKWADLSKACIIGVGGLHQRSILDRVHANWSRLHSCICPEGGCLPTPEIYHRREVECLARYFAAKSDCDAEVRGPYSGMGATNPMLIAGVMGALHIEAVHVVDVNMSQGLALDESRLKFQRQVIPPR